MRLKCIFIIVILFLVTLIVIPVSSAGWVEYENNTYTVSPTIITVSNSEKYYNISESTIGYDIIWEFDVNISNATGNYGWSKVQLSNNDSNINSTVFIEYYYRTGGVTEQIKFEGHNDSTGGVFSVTNSSVGYSQGDLQHLKITYNQSANTFQLNVTNYTSGLVIWDTGTQSSVGTYSFNRVHFIVRNGGSQNISWDAGGYMFARGSYSGVAGLLALNVDNLTIDVNELDITPDPINLDYTRSVTWVNWTWAPGTIGNDTDSYNYTINGTWYNGSANEYYNHTGLLLGDYSEIVLYAWNSTYNQLSVGYVTNNVTTVGPTPSIISFAPTGTIWPEVNDSQLFNITVDQSTQCRWYINGSLEQTNSTPSTTHAYTNSSLDGGNWNFTAVVNNTNGTDSQTWIFEVGADSTTYIVLQDQPTVKIKVLEINVIRIGSNVTDWGIWLNTTYNVWHYYFRYTNGTIIKDLTASYDNEPLWFNGTSLLPTGVYYINAVSEVCNGYQSGTTIYPGNCTNLTRLYNKLSNATVLNKTGDTFFLNGKLKHNTSGGWFNLTDETLQINSTSGTCWQFMIENGAKTNITNSKIISWNTTLQDVETDTSICRSSIYIKGEKAITVSDSNISYLGYSALTKYGFTLDDIANATIDNTTFIGNQIGIYTLGSTLNCYNIFSNLTVQNSISYGIDASTPKYMNIKDSNFKNNGDAEVVFYASSVSNTISNTVLNSTSGYGLWLFTGSCNVTAENITAISVTSHAIRLDGGASDNHILNSTVTSDSGHGVLLYNDCDSNEFDNVTVSSSGLQSFRIDFNSDDNTITDSDINSYSLGSTSYRNSFIDNNFTNGRDISHGDNLSSFNQSNNSVWINTTLVPSSTVTYNRVLLSTTPTNVSWDENATSSKQIQYSISGLNVDSSYNIYNDTTLDFTKDTYSDGALPLFSINYTANQVKSIKILEAAASTIVIPANSYGLINNWTVATNFSNIAANESNDVCYTYYNVTTGEWESHDPPYSWNADYVIPLEASVFVFVSAQTSVVSDTKTPSNTSMCEGWNMVFVEGSNNRTISEIIIDMEASL